MTDPKDITPDEAADILDGIEFKTKLLHHQAASLIWGADMDRLMWWHDIGTGKSLTALYMNQLWGFKKLLIVCPNSVMEGWAEQIERHTDWPYTLVQGPRIARKRLLMQSRGKIWVINYAGLRVVFDTHTSVKLAGFDTVIFDEIHYLSSHKTQRTKWAKVLSKYAKYVIGMTGTPYTTTEESLWAQYDVLDRGKGILGSLTNFRKKHFHGIRIPRKEGYSPTIYRIKKGETERILDRVAPITLRYSREECFDLPDRRYQTRFVDLSPEQKKFQDDIIEGNTFAIGKGRMTVSDPFLVGNKLAQVAGGFVLPTSGVALRLKANPKLDALLGLINEVPGKMIVFHSYVEEGRMIEEAVAAAGVKAVSLRGETADKSVWKKFNTEKNIRLLIAHPKSGGEGLNLHHDCSCIVFYGNGCYGAPTRDQAEGRIWRLGQKRSCLFIDLLVRGSIDEARLERVKEKAGILQAIVKYIERAGQGVK